MSEQFAVCLPVLDGPRREPPADRPFDLTRESGSQAHRPFLRQGQRAAGRRPSSRAESTVEVSADPIGRHARLGLPCQVHDPDLWFAEAPAALEFAKTLCAGCPAQQTCLAGALDRGEPCGVWGGQIFQRGRIVSHKRARGRPRKDSTPVAVWA